MNNIDRHINSKVIISTFLEVIIKIEVKDNLEQALRVLKENFNVMVF